MAGAGKVRPTNYLLLANWILLGSVVFAVMIVFFGSLLPRFGRGQAEDADYSASIVNVFLSFVAPAVVVLSLHFWSKPWDLAESQTLHSFQVQAPTILIVIGCCIVTLGLVLSYIALPYERIVVDAAGRESVAQPCSMALSMWVQHVCTVASIFLTLALSAEIFNLSKNDAVRRANP